LIADCNVILGQSAVSKIKAIPFSNDAIERQIPVWQKTDKRNSLKKLKKEQKFFALQLDESTEIQNNSIYLFMYDILTMRKVT
jgi:hypothetical protein